MDAVLTKPLRPGSLRLGLRISPDSDNRYCAAEVPTALPEAADYDVSWVLSVATPGAVFDQYVGRANRSNRAVSTMAEFRKAVEKSLDETYGDDRVLVWDLGNRKFDPAVAPDVVGEGYLVQLKSPWDVLNTALAETFGSDDPAVVDADVEVGAHWATPGILEAMKPGRMQGHGGTEEVPG